MRFSLTKTLTIARREYLTTVRRKAFLVSVFLFPALMFFSMFVGTKSASDDRRAHQRQAKIVAVVDSSGVVVPSADPMVEVSVEGPARILAVGNGDPTDHTSYGIPRRKAFHGLALALIQTTDRTGVVRVTARSDGFAPVSLTLVVVPGDPLPRVR